MPVGPLFVFGLPVGRKGFHQEQRGGVKRKTRTGGA